MSNPGMSGANMKIVTLKVDLQEGDELKEPEPKLDAGEHIEKRVVAVDGA
jgi:ADP-ribose pyrophosphatase